MSGYLIVTTVLDTTGNPHTETFRDMDVAHAKQTARTEATKWHAQRVPFCIYVVAEMGDVTPEMEIYSADGRLTPDTRKKRT